MSIDSMWAGNDSFDEQSLRPSFLNATDEDQNAAAVPNLRYRAAVSLGLAFSGAHSTQSLVSAVDLWISIVAASILVIIVLLEGFSLQQRLCYCVAAYGVFLTLHPWFHTSSNAGVQQQQTTAPSVAGPQASAASRLARMPSVTEENRQSGVLPAAYKRRKTEMEKNLKYYLSDECSWRVLKTTSGGVVSEMAANDTPFPLFKFVSGLVKVGLRESLVVRWTTHSFSIMDACL